MKTKKLKKDDNKVHIVAYSVSDEVENKLKSKLKQVLEKHDLMKLHHAIYTCLKELLMNAIKANFKNIYFENYKLTHKTDSLLSYEIALKLFMLEMTREDAIHLERLARKKNIKADILIWSDEEFLYFSIHNPIPMTEVEYFNVKEKLRIATRIKDMSEFFLETADDPNKEGAGLGLVLISLMLKGMVKNSEQLTVESDSKSTTASLRIPLDRKRLNMENFK